MTLTKILKELLSEREELDRAIDALERLQMRGRRRGPGRPPLPLSVKLRRRRSYGRRRGPGRPPGRRGPGRPPKESAAA